jgi:hypothetical protein
MGKLHAHAKGGIMQRMSILRATLAILLLLTALALGQSHASAHNVVIFHGYDKAVIGEEHFGVTVCDEEQDGNYVWAELKNTQYSITDREADGGDAGCDTEVFSVRHDRFRLCEENNGCTAWYET